MSGTEEMKLFEDIHLGVEAERFMKSDLASYILNTAEKKVIEAQNDLSVVDPTDVSEIIRLQSVITKFDHFVKSLSEMVAAGNSAYQLHLQQREIEE